MRTIRHFSWTASTLRTWAWPTLPVDHAAALNAPIVVGQTVWIVTDDGQVKKGRLLGERPAAPAARLRASSREAAT